MNVEKNKNAKPQVIISMHTTVLLKVCVCGLLVFCFFCNLRLKALLGVFSTNFNQVHFIRQNLKYIYMVIKLHSYLKYFSLLLCLKVVKTHISLLEVILLFLDSLY